jgi:hypothetical protein
LEVLLEVFCCELGLSGEDVSSLLEAASHPQKAKKMRRVRADSRFMVSSSLCQVETSRARAWVTEGLIVEPKSVADGDEQFAVALASKVMVATCRERAATISCDNKRYRLAGVSSAIAHLFGPEDNGGVEEGAITVRVGGLFHSVEEVGELGSAPALGVNELCDLVCVGVVGV